MLLAPLAASHPSHNSYTEIGWNEAGDALEVSMRIIPEELETALSWRTGAPTPVVLENEGVSGPLIEAYLADTFQIRNGAAELMPVTLVGIDTSYAESWIYFTVAVSVQERLSLRNTVLQELESQQINQVRRLWGAPGDSYLHRQGGPEQLLWHGD
jgi:hypothetical protein